MPGPALQLIPAFHLLLVDEWHLRMDQVGIACLILIQLLCVVDEHLNEVSAKLFICWPTFGRSAGLFTVHELI